MKMRSFKLGRLALADSDTMEVEWMVGTYSKPWQIWKRKQERNCVTWKEKILYTDVLFPIQLSNVKRPSTNLITKLKLAYEQR